MIWGMWPVEPRSPEIVTKTSARSPPTASTSSYIARAPGRSPASSLSRAAARRGAAPTVPGTDGVGLLSDSSDEPIAASKATPRRVANRIVAARGPGAIAFDPVFSRDVVRLPPDEPGPHQDLRLPDERARQRGGRGDAARPGVQDSRQRGRLRRAPPEHVQGARRRGAEGDREGGPPSPEEARQPRLCPGNPGLHGAEPGSGPPRPPSRRRPHRRHAEVPPGLRLPRQPPCGQGGGGARGPGDCEP